MESVIICGDDVMAKMAAAGSLIEKGFVMD